MTEIIDQTTFYYTTDIRPKLLSCRKLKVSHTLFYQYYIRFRFIQQVGNRIKELRHK